jgi:hypothetical protein
MKTQTIKKTFGNRRVSSLVPFARTPTSHSYAGKFHDYHLSVNPFETTVFDDNIIGNMLFEARLKKNIREDARGEEELEHILNRITRFKGESQRYN